MILRWTSKGQFCYETCKTYWGLCYGDLIMYWHLIIVNVVISNATLVPAFNLTLSTYSNKKKEMLYYCLVQKRSLPNTKMSFLSTFSVHLATLTLTTIFCPKMQMITKTIQYNDHWNIINYKYLTVDTFSVFSPCKTTIYIQHI